MTDDETPEDGTPENQVYWQLPRWSGETRLLIVQDDSVAEKWIAKPLGGRTWGVRGRQYLTEVESDKDDDETEIVARETVIGFDTPIPERVAEALTNFERKVHGEIDEQFNVESLRNPVFRSEDERPPEIGPKQTKLSQIKDNTKDE